VSIVKKAIMLIAAGFLIISCGGGGDGEGGSIPATSEQYVVFAWNDLGMHCLNPTYDTAVVLPPYNVLWTQVVRRDTVPDIVTSGITVTYRILNNTYSYGKTAVGTSADYAQFWDNAFALFGTNLAQDYGLNLVDAGLHNSLSGTMILDGDHYQVDGIPLTPVDDPGTWNPYQVAEITVRSSPGGEVLAQTRATVPTSDEINCGRSGCHDGTLDPFLDILQKHDTANSTDLVNSAPVLCADGNCHTSPALGQAGAGPNGYLSRAVHGLHASIDNPPGPAACYYCHPGAATKCMRSTAHNAADGNCESCHGTLAQVASSIGGGRVPWVQEPKCLDCHDGMGSEDDDAALYRNTKGHGDIYCPACHGSPHAMLPSSQNSDGYQARQYQIKAISIGSCAVCHSSSRGKGSSEFQEEHGSSGRSSACNVCHTSVPSSGTANWPHSFQWTSR
jgi:hypothetical protein